MLDAWHYFRSGPDGELLRSIPGASILGVQLCDAPATPEADPLHATLHARLLPGDGDLALRTLLADLRATGTDGAARRRGVLRRAACAIPAGGGTARRGVTADAVFRLSPEPSDQKYV